jgi:hypothetical protein
MDRQHLLDRLRLCESHIARGERCLARQRDTVARLEHGGHDASLAKQALDEFERMQCSTVANRDDILHALGE